MFKKPQKPIDAASHAISLLDGTPSEDAVRKALNNFGKTIKTASPEEKAKGLAKLATGINNESAFALWCASVVGQVIESGFDPAPIASSFRYFMAQHAPTVITGANAIWADIQKASEALGDEKEDFHDHDTIIQTHLSSNSELKRSWQKLEDLYVPLVAYYSKDANARKEDNVKYDFSLTANLNNSGYWLNKLLPTYTDAPLLVIEPLTGRGIEARMSGVTSNVQMHILLMDIFPNPDNEKRGNYSKLDVNVARGQGNANYQDSISTHWNLVNWHGAPEKSGIRDNDLAPHSVWIWHEGVPGDIPLFEDRLIVILDPPLIKRSFSWGRDFMHLDAEIVIENELSRQDVDIWLEKMFKDTPISHAP